jgi:hypothetical protein
MKKLILAYLFLTSIIRQINGENDIAPWMQEMLESINSVRASFNLAPLCYNSKIIEAAERHNKDMATTGNLSHYGSDGSFIGERVTDTTYIWGMVSENIAKGETSVSEVMNSWINSPVEYAVILNQYVIHFGAAWDSSSGFWTQVYGKPKSTGTEECVVISPTCTDGELRMRIVKRNTALTKKCRFVKPKNKERKCSETKFPGVSTTCPSACDTCDTCKDTPLEFVVKEQDGTRLGMKNCNWVSQDTDANCALPGVSSMCRSTCGVCT